MFINYGSERNKSGSRSVGNCGQAGIKQIWIGLAFSFTQRSMRVSLFLLGTFRKLRRSPEIYQSACTLTNALNSSFNTLSLYLLSMSTDKQSQTDSYLVPAHWSIISFWYRSPFWYALTMAINFFSQCKFISYSLFSMV